MSRSLVIVSVLGIEIRRFKSCHPDFDFVKFMFKNDDKALSRCLVDFKLTLPCYGFSENRLFESQTKDNGKNCFDFGCKYDLRISSFNSVRKTPDFILFRLKNLETPYDEVDSYGIVKMNDELAKILKEKCDLKTFLKARVLNETKKGFAIGAGGLVGFLSATNFVKVQDYKTLILHVESFNTKLGIVNFSQRNIHKKTHKTLLKLSSRIVFVFESNLRK